MWKKESLGYPNGITLQPNHVDSSVRQFYALGNPRSRTLDTGWTKFRNA